jgi:hypothetical protein
MVLAKKRFQKKFTRLILTITRFSQKPVPSFPDTLQKMGYTDAPARQPLE